MTPHVERLVVDVGEALETFPGSAIRLSVRCFNEGFMKAGRNIADVV